MTGRPGPVMLPFLVNGLFRQPRLCRGTIPDFSRWSLSMGDQRYYTSSVKRGGATLIRE